jgi:adenosylcobinamide-GDP ribazoletransferase
MVPTPLADLLICLRFFSRLPLPTTSRETALGADGLARAVAMVPMAGAIVGLFPATILVLIAFAGLPPLLLAPLAIATLVLVTGALHEDGLADCADGFGGGRTRERKLEIMRDSRIGTYGACAIGLSLYLRVASLTVMAAHDVALSAAVLVSSAALSRPLCLLPLALLKPARSEGAGAAQGHLSTARLAGASVLAAVIGLLPVFTRVAPGIVLLSVVAGIVAALGVCAVSRRQIGGQTGDVAGAAQQAAELAQYLIYAAA